MLHMLCGKIGAGKSTLAKALAAQEASVLISEDAWLDALFGDRMATGADYMQYAAKLRTILAPHVADLLSAGVCVVLDFPANTVDQRAWMRDLVAETGTDHALHVLDVSVSPGCMPATQPASILSRSRTLCSTPSRNTSPRPRRRRDSRSSPIGTTDRAASSRAAHPSHVQMPPHRRDRLRPDPVTGPRRDRQPRRRAQTLEHRDALLARASGICGSRSCTVISTGTPSSRVA
jgi:hypothetical protein